VGREPAVRRAVAVVGAGIVGCLTAREITARAGETPVVVLDRDVVGSGATLRSAGMHVLRGRSERVRRMSAYSHDYYARLKGAHPSLPVRAVDMWVVACETGEAELRAAYPEGVRLTPAVLPSTGPVRVPDGATAWEGRGCHYADVRGVALTVARELRPLVSFREGVRVTGIEPGREAVLLELSTGESLIAGYVVLAPGPWLAAPAWRSLVAPLGLRVKKIVALHLDVAPSAGDRAIVFQDEDAFLLPLVDRGHWLFSYTCQEWDVDPDTVASGIGPRDVEEACEVLGRYAPALVERCAGGRVFCDAYSPEREPRVQALDGAGRVVLAGAAGGSGYRLAPAMAAEAADLLRP
jgi:glycine/D-amino acid oxidase-like deaminating enzyme